MEAAQDVLFVYQCQRCSRQSPVEAAFLTKKRADGSLARCICFECENKRASRSTLLFYALFAISGSLVLFLNPDSSLGSFYLLIFASLLVSIPLTVLHELAHALTARMLNFRVFAIHLGLGKVLFSQRAFGINWTVHLVPSSAVTLVTGQEMHNFKARLFLIHLAGPLFHAILNAVLIWISAVFGVSGLWYQAIQWTNVFFLIFNLIPHKGQVAVGLAGTDGWAMLHVPRFTQEELRQHFASYYVLETVHAVENGDLQAAREFAEKGIALYPENPNMHNALGYAYINAGQFLKAREIFVQTLHSSENLPIATKGMLLNNIAFANLMLDDPSLYQEADRFSEQAYQFLPWDPSVTGTRGGVLVLLDRPDEGVTLLKQALNKNPDKRGKAIEACLLAWGEWKRGQAGKSDAYLALAGQLDPGCILLEGVRDKVQTGAWSGSQVTIQAEQQHNDIPS